MSLLLVGVLATVITILNVLMAWHGFSPVKKLEALCLLLILVLGPIRFARAKDKLSHQVGWMDIALWGYLCVMIATSIFTR